LYEGCLAIADGVSAGGWDETADVMALPKTEEDAAAGVDPNGRGGRSDARTVEGAVRLCGGFICGGAEEVQGAFSVRGSRWRKDRRFLQEKCV